MLCFELGDSTGQLAEPCPQVVGFALRSGIVDPGANSKS